MRKKIIACLLAYSALANVAQAGNSITFYRDGAIIEREASALKGVAEVPLEPGLLEGTLKVVPAVGSVILGVEINAARQDGKSSRELEALIEQRQRLEDRLQALATREEIFKAAAKSQSGKSPRKTKANPDPMQTIRQGTDFAIAQLEAVYTTRRKTTQEIKKVENRIAVLKRGGKSGGTVRISVSPPRGRLTVRYATAETGWQPWYDLHLNGSGVARLQLSAKMTANHGGYRQLVSAASLMDATTAATFPVQSGNTKMAEFQLPITEENFDGGIYNRFSGRLGNTGTEYLPPGEAGLFRSGTYLGRFRFEGLSSGRNRLISSGM
ncbi:MAG: hypothetical protein A2X85_14360 [Geobacteraceae bacterium GWF2_54_21]|nr:MAG: hypothetical protein A2X85_14360 [Geobacteraceae bacterium GWF2_54_21]